MPWVTINLMEGHNAEEKAALFSSVTQAVSQSLNVPEDYVRIQLVEMTADNHAIAGKSLKDK